MSTSTTSSTELQELRERNEFLKDQLDEAHFRIRGLDEDIADKRKEIDKLVRQITRFESEGVKAGLVEDLFNLWVGLNNKRPTTKLTPDRRKAITAAVKLHGEAAVRKVIAQNAKTPYLVYTAWRAKGNRDSLRDIGDFLGKGKHFDALLEMADERPELEWTEARVSQAHTLLLSTEAVLERLANGKGWTADTLETLGVGLDKGRLIFPVRDAAGELTAVIKYHPRLREADKELVKSYADGPRGLFPAPETIDSTVMWLVEGEPDAITAHEMWLPAVAIPGAGVSVGDWMARFKGKRVIVCLDCDHAGRQAANRIARPLTQYATEVRIVDLDPLRDDGYDLTDWFRKGKSRKDLEELADRAKPVTRVASPSLLPQQSSYSPISADTRFDRFIRALEAKDCDPKELRGGQWRSLCPAHEDRVPTLYFRRGDSAPVITDCKAGCTWDQISDSLGQPTKGKE